MSEINRVFLGWDAPLVNKVRDYLLESVKAGDGKIPDLQGNLIVVPTRQAGRRLRESLALWCDSNNTALLSAQIVTPNFLFSSGLDNIDVVGDVLSLSIWVNVLLEAELEELSALFPSLDNERNFQWALNTGEIIQSLRDELSDGAYSINGIVEQYAAELEELDRWQDLASLESLYLADIEKIGKTDKCIAKISAAQSLQLDPDIKKIIVAGVPDPSLLALTALKTVAAGEVAVEILVHADPGMDAAFDEWGRPDPEHWRNMNIDVPGWQTSVSLEATPSAQAERVCAEMADNAETFEAGEVSIGVPDRSVIPFIEKTLGAEGVLAFDPSDHAAADHPVGLLGRNIADLIQYRSYDVVADLLRHPDFLAYLKDQHSLESLDVLGQLDDFQNTYLPLTFDAMLRPFTDNPSGSCSKYDDFTELGKALDVISSHLDLFMNESFEEAWRTFYKKIYEQRMLKAGVLRDAEFENAATAVDSVLREFRDLSEQRAKVKGFSEEESPVVCRFDVVELSSLFTMRLGKTLYHRERRNEVIDLEGWLELPWNDRPFLIVTGMNEEFVPGGSLSDAFLPDSLRRLLDLRDDSARFARDVFLMQGMIKSREKLGRVRFVVGKTATSNDPLKPSRLLFRCDDSELPGRVEKLLAELKDMRSRPYAELIFTLDPWKENLRSESGELEENTYISVTSFKSYLACPFRYYLGNVLEMQSVSDDKVGLDHMDFGNVVHDVLQMMGEDKKLWACTDPVVLGDKLSALAASHIIDRYGAPIPLSVEISLMSAQERLRAAALAQVRLLDEGWVIKAVETGSSRIRRGGFTIGGRIDRIDENTRTGRIRIIDYKTFDKPRSPESEHLARRRDDAPGYNEALLQKETKSGSKTEEKRWTDLQLPLYAMIYKQDPCYDENIELAYFALPKAISQTGIVPWAEFNEARMNSAMKCVDGVIDGISRKVFWPPAENIKYDDFEDMFRFENSIEKL